MVTATQSAIELALDQRDAALAALDAGDPDTADRQARTALEDLEAAGGGEAEVASVLTVLGEVRATLSDLAGAHALVTRAAGLLHRSDDPDRLRLWCQIHTRLAGLERHAGDLGGAERRLLEVIAVAASDDTMTAALNSLGIVYKYAARFDEAEAAYLRALATEPDPLTVADLCHNLGGLDHARGRPEPGIVWAERGLALREAALGLDHPDTAADAGALGALYHLAGRRGEASAAYHRALRIFEARFGPDHYEVGMTCANLAALASDEGRYGEAVRMGERAMSILARVLGPEHPEVGLTLHNLGIALDGDGRHAEATAARTRALAISQLTALEART